MEHSNSITLEVPTLETVARKRAYPTSLFAVALLCFFFNFCEMSCQGRRFAAVSGIQLAIGTQIESPQQQNPFGFSNPEEDSGKRLPGNVWAAIALLAAAGGLAVFMLKRPKENLLGMIAGAIGTVSLILLHSSLNSDSQAQGGGVIQLSFLMPYWISLLSLSGACAICWLRNKRSIAPAPINMETLTSLFKSNSQPTATAPQEPVSPAFELPEAQLKGYTPVTESYSTPVTFAVAEPLAYKPTAVPEEPVEEEVLTSQPLVETPVQTLAPPVWQVPPTPAAEPATQLLSSHGPTYHQQFQVPQQPQPYQAGQFQNQTANTGNWLQWVVICVVVLLFVATILVELL